MEVRFHCSRWAELPRLELYLDQVTLILEEILAPVAPDGGGVTSTIINNYVKQKVLAPTVKKKYDRAQLADLVMLFLLKRALSTAEIVQVLQALKQDRTPQQAYDLFCGELEYHLNVGGLAEPAECPALVRAALQALAGKIRFELLLAEAAPQPAVDEKPAKPQKAAKEKADAAPAKSKKTTKGITDGEETVENKGEETL